MRIVLTIALAAFGAGCTTDVCSTNECETQVVVARNVSFAPEEGDGIADGFDLDGIVSTGEDLASCNREDYTSPDGRPGIDNQFAVLWDAIVDVIGDAAEGLILGAINDGNLLFMIEMVGVDDRLNDDCVDLNVFLGSGTPYVGTDGYIVSGQTFDTSGESLGSHISCGRIEDGVLTAGPFDGVLPISILDVSFDLRVYGAMIRGELAEDGSMSAKIGAGVDSAQIIEVAEGADYRLEGLVSTLVRNRSDLARDDYGDCQRLSATMVYDGTSAFLFEDE